MELPDVSVIAPLYNERDNVLRLAAELTSDLAGLRAEILVVDDGSDDGSAEALRTCPELIYLGRPHRGKSAALRAGLEWARAPILATIDADLQEDPRAVPEMVRRLHEGFDCVSAVRRSRQAALPGVSFAGNPMVFPGARTLSSVIGTGYRAAERAVEGLPA